MGLEIAANTNAIILITQQGTCVCKAQIIIIIIIGTWLIH
jgi:hypothetical protein